jgi:glucuronosyltransferase
MKKLSAIYRDRPQTPLEQAVFWTEYVLRHGGTPLRSVSAELPLYQYLLLDVIAVLFIGTFLACASLYFVLRLVYTVLLRFTISTKSKQQ